MLAALAEWPAALVLTVAAVVLVVESGLLIGLGLPGLTTLVALGLWVGSDDGVLAATLVVAPAATVLGAHLSYLRGRRRSASPRPVWAPGWLRGLVVGRGPLATVTAVACAHWTVAARLWLPRVAGRLKVPYRVFGPTVTVSGWAWASTYILVSHLLGRQVAERTGWAALIGVVLLAAGVLTVLRFRPAVWRRGALGRSS